jgi:hypothetical protein
VIHTLLVLVAIAAVTGAVQALLHAGRAADARAKTATDEAWAKGRHLLHR